MWLGFSSPSISTTSAPGVFPASRWLLPDHQSHLFNLISTGLQIRLLGSAGVQAQSAPKLTEVALAPLQMGVKAAHSIPAELC